MKTYLELEGKLGNQPCTKIFCLTKTHQERPSTQEDTEEEESQSTSKKKI